MQNQPIPVWLARTYVFLFALLPWSVEISFGSWRLTVPAEPLAALAGVGLFAHLLRQKRWPLTGIAGLATAWVGWQAVAAAGSSMPVVSGKYWVVEAGQWWVFFGGLWLWPALWPRLIRVFTWSMAGVVLYTLAHHGIYHFRADQSLLAPMPFFDDHNIYGAVLAMLVWMAAVLPATRPPAGEGPYRVVLRNPALSTLLFLVAIVLSTSRATGLSLFVTGMTGVALKYPRNRYWLGLAFFLAVGAGYGFREAIAARLAADVSVQERLNRYSCALRMAADRPWMGFGPGTFPFQYLPYQRTGETTRISIYAPLTHRGPDNYGRGGGAHSEYLQALAELGWPGFLLFLTLALGSTGIGIARYRQTGRVAWLLLALGLATFFLHGLANNFLHDARVAALVWGGIAMLWHPSDTPFASRTRKGHL